MNGMKIALHSCSRVKDKRWEVTEVYIQLNREKARATKTGYMPRHRQHICIEQNPEVRTGDIYLWKIY
jgi:hypothetical protein